MKAARRHPGSPPSLLGGHGARRLPRAAGGPGSAAAQIRALPLAPAEGAVLRRPFRPHRPGSRCPLRNPFTTRQFQIRRGTRLFGEAEKAEPWIPPAQQQNRCLLPSLTAR